jgi:hypothetical protein
MTATGSAIDLGRDEGDRDGFVPFEQVVVVCPDGDGFLRPPGIEVHASRQPVVIVLRRGAADRVLDPDSPVRKLARETDNEFSVIAG